MLVMVLLFHFKVESNYTQSPINAEPRVLNHSAGSSAGRSSSRLTREQHLLLMLGLCIA